MKRATLVALLGIAVCGCAPDVPVRPTENGGIAVADAMGSASVYEIKLSDGTRCAVMVGMYKGALFCDWK